MNEVIEFTTREFKHQFSCYLKNNKYDVYLDGKCIKTKADIGWILTIKTLFEF